MHRTRTRCLRAALLAVALTSTSAAQAFGWEPRVPEGYFGISAPSLTTLARDSDPRLATHVDGIRDAGIDFVRATVDWRQVEPLPGTAGVHVYNWSAPDRLVSALASRGLEFVPNLNGTPVWARAIDATTCGTGGAIAELHAPAFGDFAGAVVDRYGAGGSFWSAHPELTPQPVRRIEVWNEPNWTGSWCPIPQPERFATALVEAAREIEVADPSVETILGGLVLIKEDMYFPGGGMRGMESGKFLTRMVAAKPALGTLLDQVAVHLYDPDPDLNVSLLGWFRARLRDAGLGSAGIFVSEFGWHTQGGNDSLSEEARSDAYRNLIEQLPRTDCDVRGLAAHDWVTDEIDATDPEDWFGIADPLTGALRPAGEAYRDALAIFEGRGATPAPREPIPVCGAPAPDQDSDGTPDSGDDYPLDPTRNDGSGEQPPTEPPAEQPVREARVGDRYFSVASAFMPVSSEERQLHYDSMADVGVTSVRQDIQWDHLEPSDGVPAAARFAWTDTDRRLVAYAKRGIATSLAPLHAPAWLPEGSEAADLRFAGFLEALARRYGSQGRLWAENRHLDDSLAPRDYEIWTDANLDSSAWDGSASASEYSATYATARAALRAADPSARAIVSLVDGGDGSDAAAFIRGMVQARPALAGQIDGVYVMAFGARTPDELEGVVAKARFALEAAGNPGARLRIGFGAPTAGPGAMSEQARAAFVTEAASRLPRLDCGVDEAVLYSWSSAQADATNAWDWFGVTALADGAPTSTATAFASVARSVTGFGPVEPARPALHPCLREPLDRDGDGTPDAVDPAPIDPARSAPQGQPPAAPRIDSGPAPFAASSSATLTYSSAGAVSFQCRLDSAGWERCQTSRGLTGLAEGSHTFTVRAVDALGLTGSPARHEWTVDTRKPETTITAGPSGLTLQDDVGFGTASDETGARILCRLDSQPWNWCNESMSYADLGEGSHSFAAVAVDRAGNADATQASRFFEVRTVPGNPSVEASGLDTQLPAFSFSAAHSASFECRFDEQAFSACAQAGRHTPAQPLPHGQHRFEVRGVGPTGKRGPVAGWGFTTRDTRAPDTSISSGPTGTIAPGRVEFGIESDEAGVAFLCKLDAEAWRPCQASTTFDDLPDGRHVFQAVAVDAGNNTDPSPALREFVIASDVAGPSLDLHLPGPSRDSTPTIRFDASDPSGIVSTECRIARGPWLECVSPFTTRRLSTGRHLISVRVSDSVGNKTERSGKVRVLRRQKRGGRR